MIQREKSFENQLINIFWGLAKGSKLLKPYSGRFKELGFKIVGFELSFHAYTHNRRVTPDMVLESVDLKESIITEWTQGRGVSDGKVDQIRRYINIDDDSLRIFVSEPCVENKDIVLIVTPEAQESYKQLIESRKLQAILLVYHYPNDYLLEKKLNSFNVSETESFFNQPLQFKRIPYSFPDINLSNLSKSLLVDSVISTLIEILVREDEGFEFSIQYFVQRMLKKPFYNLLSGNKRTEIAGVSKNIISELMKRRYGTGIIDRTKLNPPTWKIIIPQARKLKRIRLIKRKFEEFANQIAGRPIQPTLFDNLDNGGNL